MKLAAMLLMFGLLAGGCATVIAPARTPDSVPVYLTDYGRHSSVLITTSAGNLNEYAYGDFDWFALNRCTKFNAFRALFFSKAPTLGRRQLVVEDNIDAVTAATKAKTIVRFQVARNKADALVARLDKLYNDRLDSVTYNSRLGLWFVRGGPHYSVLHNCNHATAGWLKELGCRVRGMVAYSRFKVESAHIEQRSEAA